VSGRAAGWSALHLLVFGVAAGLMASGGRIAGDLVLGLLVVLGILGIIMGLAKPSSPIGPSLLRLGRSALFGALLGMLVFVWR